MSKNKVLKAVCMSCILALLSGCGTKAPQVPSATAEPSANTQTVVKTESQRYITVAEAKAAVLENAGLSEENVKFVRVNLDSESGAARYDIEFISEETEYDYTVDALTGEILSMIFENGTYDIENIPQEVIQAAEEQSDAQNTPTQDAQADAQQPAAESIPSRDAQTAAQQPAAESVPSRDAQTAAQQPAAESVPSQDAQTAAQQSQTGNVQPKAAGGQSGTKQQYIGVEAAKKIALEHAGLQADAVRFVHAHLDFDDGCWQYDVEFHKDNTEYDYNIDAQSGRIISYDYDAEYYQHGTDSPAGSGQITGEQAKQIALEYAGIAESETKYLTIEFDYDDGRAEYQVEWYVGRMEYSCDVDANTGAIISFEKEYD